MEFHVVAESLKYHRYQNWEEFLQQLFFFGCMCVCSAQIDVIFHQ